MVAGEAGDRISSVRMGLLVFRVFTCLTTAHDLRLVLLAAAVCLASSFVAMALVQRALRARGASRGKWIATAGAATGFGVWATHFIAMLAYDPGVVTGYNLPLTALSLLAAIGVTIAGIALAINGGRRLAAPLGGATVGLGIASMHFLGMAALELPGHVSWSPDLVVASILLGVAGSTAAAMTVASRGRRRVLLPGLLLTLAIVAHHFTAMGAVTVTPDPSRAVTGATLSPSMLSIAIAAVAAAILSVCAMAAGAARREEQAVRDSERRFSLLVRGVTDYAIYMLDADGKVSNWNAGAERVKGYAAEEVVGTHVSRFYTPEEREAGAPERALRTALAEGRYEAEGWRVRKDGSRFWAHVVLDAVHEEDGSFVGFAKITRDITEKKASADRQAELARNLDLALTNMSQGLCLFDAEERLVLANRRYMEMFGFDDSLVAARASFLDVLRRVAEQDSPDAEAAETLARSLQDENRAILDSGGGEIIVEDASRERVLSIVHSPMADGSWVTTFDDITQRRRSEAKIAHMARHDALTGLPNRVHFTDHLQAELARADNTGQRVAVAGLDLDRFKEVNDLRGHSAGDEVLRVLSTRLARVLRDGEFAARLGGDEFAAIKRFERDEELQAFLQRLETELFVPFTVDGFEITPAASIGVAIYPADGESAEQLVNNADLAMYRAKSSLNQTVCFYEAPMDEAARERRGVAADLWAALERDEFTLHYQVQRSVTSGEITGYEALVRWRHPQRGLVPPDQFIPVAEECGAILKLGEWVLRTACAEAAGWPEPHKIAVNLSPVQLSHGDLVTLVHEVLIQTGLQPSRLELEITESTIIGDKVRALHALRRIKALGVTIAIDDFGTGYSSLDTLNSFPFDKIKIDRSFLIEAETRPQAKAIIRAILALGRSLNVPVLAEGVETETQLALLRAEGCDEAQGYLFGRPQPRAAFDELPVSGSVAV
jgi:diguanylate cyclase (GGDEF)-like protein/PAS domain S-box-containing protein